MPKDTGRIHRVEELIQRALAQILQLEMRDPRIGMVTISSIEVTRDLAQAKVYVSILNEDPEKVKVTMTALNEAAGFLRSKVAERVKLRTTPKLFFVYDESIERGNRLSRLIDEAMSKEKPSSDSEDS